MHTSPRTSTRIKATIIILIIGFLSINLYVYLLGEKYSITNLKDVPPTQVAIILGAAVTQSGQPSAVLEDRVLAAIKLYKEGKVSKILMSGGNSTITQNEVDPIRKVLVAQGIPIEDIFLDHAGYDTYSSMYRAKEVFHVSSAIIVTQEFHIPRAVFTARTLGIDAYGFAADRGDYTLKNYVREFFSRPVAVWDLITQRVPKYVGPAIPIMGDGSTT